MIDYPYPKKMNCPITKEKEKKVTKYRNKKVLIDDIWFQSTKEGDRYLVLKDKLKHGEITDLRLQVKYELQPSYKIGNKTIRSINYLADFTYFKHFPDAEKVLVVEDTKGYRTEIYKLKKKIFEYKYKIEIREI